jgi:ubiquinone/menaquinone biosynthesis C-methylase UbiE
MFTTKDRLKCEQLFDKYYAGCKFYDSLYQERIRKHLVPGQSVLDAGCGTYLKYCKILSDEALVTGIDLECRLETTNKRHPFGVCGDMSKLPFGSGTFDMVISRSVIEHLNNPHLVFREFLRVLRPGGKVVVITPNKYDYVSIIAAFTPYWLHRKLVGAVFTTVSEDDVYPTRYRANTSRSLRSAFAGSGFEQCELDMINHYPAYLMFSPVLFRLGVLYERLTRLNALRMLRGSILGVFEKPGSAAEVDSGSEREIALGTGR